MHRKSIVFNIPKANTINSIPHTPPHKKLADPKILTYIMISSSSTHPKANTIKSPDTQQHMQTQNPPIFKIFITPTWHAQRIRHLQPPKANTINPFLNPPDTQNKCTQSPLNQNYSKPSESSSSITCTKNHHLRPFPRPTRFKWLPQFPRHPNQNQMHTPTQPTQNPFPP